MNPPWVRILGDAHKRPVKYLGNLDNAHLMRGIVDPIHATWQLGVFEQPKQTIITVSPNQLYLRSLTGGMVADYASLFDWEACDILIDEVSRVGTEIRQRVCEPRGEEWERKYRRFPGHLGTCTGLLMFAARGLFAIRSDKGIWCQTYERGWPKVPPEFLSGKVEVGLCQMMSLDPQWHPGLPFRLDDVEACIPDFARAHTTVEWRDADNVVPETLDRLPLT